MRSSAVLLIAFLGVALAVTTEFPTEEVVTRGKVNGKTYFFQMRKESAGNETTYRKVKESDDGIRNSGNVEFTVTHSERSSPLENLRMQRREHLKMERLRNTRNWQFLDDEWKYNVNNEYVEVPEITNELFRSMEEKSTALQNVSQIRFLFENYENVEDTIKFELDTLANKTDQVLVDAELHIYRFSEVNETEDKGPKYSSDQVVRLYQVLPINETEENGTNNPDVHKLLNVIYVSSQYSGWQVFKVRNVVENWLTGEENLGFLISATDTWENIMPMEIGRKYSGKYQPTLIVYLNKAKRRKSWSNTKRLDKKQVENFLYLSRNTLPNSPMSCSRHVWYVSFQEMGWNNFIISPSGFMAFRCKGSCVSPKISPFTNHALILNAIQNNLKRPCCVPDNFKSLTVMFYDRYQNVVIKIYDDMVVDSCACR